MKVCVLLLSFIVVSCTVTTKKITPEKLVSFGNKEVNQFYKLQSAPRHRMDIYEVSARVLKYSLERRLKQMESDLSLNKFRKMKRNLLPKLDFDTSYSARDKQELTDSYSISTDTYNAADSISREKEGRTDRLEFSWNVLDFGVSYLSAKQKSDEVLLAREQRRKSIFSLLEKAYTNYWYVVAAEKYEGLATSLSKDIDKALSKLSTSELADVLPEESLSRQKNLLKNKRTVNETLRQLREKKIELADLMGLPANTKFNVYTHRELLPVVNLNSDQVDQSLFANHPDLRIAAYREKINLADSKIEFYRLFPRLSLNLGYSAKTDKYLVNKEYGYAGVTAAWNLFNLLNIYNQKKIGRLNRKFAKNVRIANGVAVLTAARVKELLYRNALERYADDVHLHLVEKQLSKTMRSMEAVDIVSFIDVVETRVSEMKSGLERVESYAKLMRYALSIANVLSESEFNYDLDKISLLTLKNNLKNELSMMPISWIGKSSHGLKVPNSLIKSEISRVQKLWRTEGQKGVAEKGDNRFNPNQSLTPKTLERRPPVLLKPVLKKTHTKKMIVQAVAKKSAALRQPYKMQRVKAAHDLQFNL